MLILGYDCTKPFNISLKRRWQVLSILLCLSYTPLFVYTIKNTDLAMALILEALTHLNVRSNAISAK